MNTRKDNLGTSASKAKLNRAAMAAFESLESRELMSTLNVFTGSNVTLDVTAGGGIETVIDGVKTDYSAGSYGNVVVDTAANITVKATVVPVSISYPGPVTFHGTHGMSDIKAMVSVVTGNPGDNNYYPFDVTFDDTGDTTARTINMEKINGSRVIGGMAPGNIFIQEDFGYLNSTVTNSGKINMITGSGSDTVNIKHLADKDELNLDSTGGTETVTIGGGSAYQVGGPNYGAFISVSNSPYYTHLIVDYSGSNTGFGVSLDGTGALDSITTRDSGYGPAYNKISYKTADVTDVTIKHGDGVGVQVNSNNRPTNIIGYGNNVGVSIGGSGYDPSANDMRYITSPINISDVAGQTHIHFEDFNDPYARLINVNATSVTGLSPATISWVAAEVASVDVTAPNVGGNGINIHSTAAPTTIHCGLTGATAVNITNNGSVQGINGPVTIDTGVYSFTNIIIDDSADTTARSATLSVFGQYLDEGSTLSGLAPAAISWPLMTIPVTIQGGSGGDTFTVNDTPSYVYYDNTYDASTIDLNTGTGNDTVNVKATGIYTVLNIDGQSGLDSVNIGNNGYARNVEGTVNVTNTSQYTQLTVDDSADLSPRTISLDTLPPNDSHPWGTITGAVSGAVNYRALDMKDPITIKGGVAGNTVVVNSTPNKTVGGLTGNTINLLSGSGADHVTIKSICAGTTLNIDGQNGTDPVTVGDNGSVQEILGTVNLANKNGYEDATIDDGSDNANRNVTIGVLGAVPGNTQGTIMGLAPGIINFVAADINGLAINGGSGSNIYTFTGTPTTQANGFYGPTLTLFAGTGADIVNVTGMGNGTGLKIYGQAQDDVLNIDYSGGGIPLNHTITFAGGGAAAVGDSLTIHGQAASSFNAVAGQVSLGAAGHVNFSDINALYFKSGTYNVNGDMNLPALVAQNADTHVIFNTSQTIGKLVLDNDASAAVAPGGGKVLALNSLALLNNSQLDLADNAMIVDYTGASPLTSIQSIIKSGFANGAWSGPGLTSSSADASVHGLGYAEASALGVNNFAGRNVDGTAVLVKYTYFGDANLDGKVDVSDLGRLATNWQKSGVWSDGDFNYDGLIDVSDLGRLATNWQQGVGNPLSAVSRVGAGSLSAHSATRQPVSLFSDQPIAIV